LKAVSITVAVAEAMAVVGMLVSSSVHKFLSLLVNEGFKILKLSRRLHF
jgi:hypothetical protein